MRIEDVNAEIRPRDSWEAMDLGLALVRRDFWALWGMWLAAATPWLLLAWWWGRHPFWWLFAFWWCRPAQSRLVLYFLSRRLFGERPVGRDLWRCAVGVINPARWARLSWGRLSPWLPVAMPVEELEELKGGALRQRLRSVVNRASGAAIRLSFFAMVLVPWLAAALISLGLLFLPRGQSDVWQIKWEIWQASDAILPPLIIGWTFSAGMALAISLVDVFATGAGFGLYLNSRSWIEGWDVELVFKRLAERLRAVASAVVVAGMVVFAATGSAQEAEGAGGENAERDVIARVLESDDFEVHSQTIKVPKELGWNLPHSSFFTSLRGVLGWVVLGLSVAVVGLLIGWLLYRYRHAFGVSRGEGAKKRQRGAMVVGSLPLKVDELPGDPAAVAARWWAEGRRREALALLYRAAIWWLVEHRQLEIGESATEFDCVKRVDDAASDGMAGYFRSLTETWVALAYGDRRPSELQVEALCREWPFREGAI